MNQIIYTSLFETKGIEYIIVIGFLVTLIPFWLYVNNIKHISSTINHSIDTLTQRIMNLPQGIYFSKNHTWAFMEKSGVAKVGLNDFLASITGKVNIELRKTPGDQVEKGEIVAEIQQGNKQLMITSPLTGKVIKINDIIKEQPSLINSSTYASGWLFGVKPTHWKAETTTFLLGESASRWTLNELNRFKDFLAVTKIHKNAEPELLTLQEGGELSNHVLEDLDIEIWKKFQQCFLD
jgi:glycine cleavage system H protein